MRLKAAKPEDRDAMIVILARNGYTVRQGREKPPGAKQYISYVEVVEDGKGTL